jgi:hypothetical protein
MCGEAEHGAQPPLACFQMLSKRYSRLTQCLWQARAWQHELSEYRVLST